jgi:hypothetical protein
MNQVTILNPQIKLKRDKNGKTYFSICDQQTGIAYLVFYNHFKQGWHGLESKWTKAKEIHLTHEQKKVISLTILTRKDIREKKAKKACL